MHIYMMFISFLECNIACYEVRCRLKTHVLEKQWAGWEDPSQADTNISKECQETCNDECREREIPPTATEKECEKACFCKWCTQTTDNSICSSVQGAEDIWNQLQSVLDATDISCRNGCEQHCSTCFRGRTDGETQVQCKVEFSTGPAPLPEDT